MATPHHGRAVSSTTSQPISFSRLNTNDGQQNASSFENFGNRASDDSFYVGQIDRSAIMSASQSSTDVSHQKVAKRIAAQRVFVNRSLELGKIKFFGFDMDYTLAVYKSPKYEELGFQLILDRLVKMGYPQELTKFQYDHTFPVRGLWFDNLYGNLLKVDAYGNILVALHGHKFLKQSEVEDLYPNRFIQLSEDRIYVLNTLFNLPETVVISSLVEFLDSSPDSKREKTGILMGDIYMSYKSIFKDVRNAVDWVHLNGDMKRITVERIQELVHKDKRLPQLLTNMRAAGRKTFLLTNSDYDYTNKVMTYLLDAEWKSSFDFIIVDARKPLWFAEGTVFRQVDTATGALKIGMHTGPLRPGQVYAGGSCQVFSDMVGIRGKEVLYVGDHIFGDVLRSKKGRGWRTFLIIPELMHELRVWIGRRDLFNQLENLNKELAEIFLNMDIESAERPTEKIANLRKLMLDVTHRMDQSFGMAGSLFRSGSRQTFFASQVERYADIYASSCCNLMYYPLFYFFRAEPMLMPHESTVDWEHAGPLEIEGSNPFQPRNRNMSIVDAPKLFANGIASPETPSPTPDNSKNVIPQGQPKPAVMVQQTPAPSPVSPKTPSTSSIEGIGKAQTPRQSTYVHEEGSDDDSPKSKGIGETDRPDGRDQKSIRKRKQTDARVRVDSENEPQTDTTKNVGDYEDIVVAQPPVVEELPKQ